MPNLSAALREAYARSDSSTRHLIGVEIIHEAMPGGSLAFVNYDRLVRIDNVDHTGMAMELKEPEYGGEPANDIRVRIDGVAGTFQYYINQAIQSGKEINVIMRPIAFNMETETVIDIVGVMEYLVTEVDYDMTACVLTCGLVSPTNQKFPKLRYTPETHPGLYA